MSFHQNDIKDSPKDLQYYADVIAELYKNQTILNFKPMLNKGVRAKNGVYGPTSNSSDKRVHMLEMNNMFSKSVEYKYNHVSGHDAIDSILKKTLQSNIRPSVKLTPNGIKRDELKKGIQLLQTQINQLIACNRNGDRDAELDKSQKALSVFEQKYADCLEEGHFEIETDYKEVAKNALLILFKSDSESEQLHKLINLKFGIKVNHLTEYMEDRRLLQQYTKKEQITNAEEEKSYHRNFVNHNTTTKKYVPSYKVVKKEEVDLKNAFPDLLQTTNTQPIVKTGAWAKPLKIEVKEEIIENNYIAPQDDEKDDIEETW
jgi:hypothetical protein